MNKSLAVLLVLAALSIGFVIGNASRDVIDDGHLGLVPSKLGELLGKKWTMIDTPSQLNGPGSIISVSPNGAIDYRSHISICMPSEEIRKQALVLKTSPIPTMPSLTGCPVATSKA